MVFRHQHLIDDGTQICRSSTYPVMISLCPHPLKTNTVKCNGQVCNAAPNNWAAPNNRAAVHKVCPSSAPRQCTQQKQSSPFRPYSRLFATRFGPGTTEREVLSFIQNMTRYSLRPVKLQTKHDGYCSFYIECDKGRWDDLLTPDVWPTGILVKVYQ